MIGDPWDKFVEISTRSNYLKSGINGARAFSSVIENVKKLPDAGRLLAAVILTPILKELEWQDGFCFVRLGLISGLNEVLAACDTSKNASFASLLALNDDALFLTGRSMLKIAFDLVVLSSTWDHIAIVAKLCNVGHSACIRSYRKALNGREKAACDDSFETARFRYVIAYEKYAIAARDANKRLGVSLFQGLEVQLEVDL